MGGLLTRDAGKKTIRVELSGSVLASMLEQIHRSMITDDAISDINEYFGITLMFYHLDKEEC